MKTVCRVKTVVGLVLAVVLAGFMPPHAHALTGRTATPGQPHPQGYLGIDVRDIGDEKVTALHLKDSRGAEIVVVDHDGPAGKAGLRPHDVVLQVNGQPIEGEDQIRHILREMPPGRTLVLLISREGVQMTITAQMSNRELVERQAWEQHMTVPDPASAPAAETFSASTQSVPGNHMGRSFLGTILMSPAYTGAMLEMMGPQLAQFFGAPDGAGLLVRSVEPNSPAAQAGLKAGDVAIRANSLKLAKTSDWAKTIHDSRGHAITLTVLRDKKELTLSLIPDEKRRSSLLWPWSPATETRTSVLAWMHLPTH